MTLEESVSSTLADDDSEACVLVYYHKPHQETLSLDGVLDKLLNKLCAFKTNSSVPSSYTVDYVVNVLNTAFSFPVVKRDYVERRIETVRGYQQKLDDLRALPVVEQRTEQWYNMRKNMITASDFAQALGEGKFGSQKQFFQKKCGYEEDKFNANCPPLKWGVMFEPVAGEIYCIRYGYELHEFGLLPHSNVPFFGASPDGISNLGIMLEIKCPYKRKITGEIPLQYYYQIQGQLDVCGLAECDYMECEFMEYDDVNAFLRDTTSVYERGVVLEFLNNDQTTFYKYSTVVVGCHATDAQRMVDWAEKASTEMGTGGFVKAHFWRLVTFNIVRVYKNSSFVEEKLSLLANVWDKKKAYQADKELYLKEVGVKRVRESKDAILGYAFVDDDY